jgi:hypothetical protein
MNRPEAKVPRAQGRAATSAFGSQDGGQTMSTQKRSGGTILWGVILVAAGVVLLAQTLGLAPSLSGEF